MIDERDESDDNVAAERRAALLAASDDESDAQETTASLFGEAQGTAAEPLLLSDLDEYSLRYMHRQIHDISSPLARMQSVSHMYQTSSVSRQQAACE